MENNVNPVMLCGVEMHAQNKSKYQYPCVALSQHTKKKLYYLPHPGAKTSTETPCHLYVVSDQDVRDGDWYRLTKSGKVFILKNTGQYKLDTSKYAMLEKEDIPYKKIIATTNESLGIFILTQKFVYRFMDKWEENSNSLEFVIAKITENGLEIKHIKDKKTFSVDEMLKLLGQFESDYISKVYISGKGPNRLEWLYSKII